VGDLNRAYNLFNFSLCTDISNLYGNTCDGIHAACLGGTWQAIIFGFAGIKIKKEKLHIAPRMPRTWNKILFSFIWKGVLFKFEMGCNSVKVRLICSKKIAIKAYVFNREVLLKVNRTYEFRRPSVYRKEDYY
jgi:trehalose/maltose hydrolase-like predicted phosphorylase